tara:strand:+ start:1637 stop:2338 length:702 start_codon:yes stop_codon:yes gene_type:complete
MDIYKLTMNTNNFYKELGVPRNASKSEIKSAYRLLAKKYHPDTGGSNDKFLAIQSAWETLNDPQKKMIYDKSLSFQEKSDLHIYENWSVEVKNNNNSSTTKDHDIKNWIINTYQPLNRLITQVIKPLNQEIRKLSADPYDDELMEKFCEYIRESQKKIDKVSEVYKSRIVPSPISSLGLDLYHCYSQVQDALDQLDRYTKGYVDNYLFDGKEMMKEAKRIQTKMSISKKNISF